MSEGTIWKLVERYGEDFAQCWLRSPPEEAAEPCASCTARTVYRIPVPLVLEWEVGSDRIGDFVWPGGGRVAVTKNAFDLLSAVFPSLRASPVEMIQDPKLKRPTRKGRAKPRVWLPYEGPPLVELMVEGSIPLLASTTTKVRSRCKICGAEALDLVGVEDKGQRWNLERQELVPFHRRRTSGKGLFVARSSVGNRELFRTEPFSSAIFCTDKVRDFVIERGLANIDFLEFGSFF